MAVFGLPGGAEWLVIGLIVLLTLVPAVAVFLGGYVLGRSKGRDEAAPAPKPAAPETSEDDDE